MAIDVYSTPTVFVPHYNSATGALEPADDYREAYAWIEGNTAADATVLSWWDLGYQLTYMTQRRTLVDNHTWHHGHISFVARVFTSSEEEAYRHLVAANVDYVVVNFGGRAKLLTDDLSKITWMQECVAPGSACPLWSSVWSGSVRWWIVFFVFLSLYRNHRLKRIDHFFLLPISPAELPTMITRTQTPSCPVPTPSLPLRLPGRSRPPSSLAPLCRNPSFLSFASSEWSTSLGSTTMTSTPPSPSSSRGSAKSTPRTDTSCACTKS